MIRVHHLNTSRSQRVLWLLEELDVPYEVINYQRNKATMRAPKALRDIHPLGKAPVVEHDGQVLAETGLILEYLVATFGPQLAPSSDNPNIWRYRYWMHYAEGSLMSAMLLKLVAHKMGPFGWPIRSMTTTQLNLHYDFLEQEAGKFRWLAGDAFSAADIMMGFPLDIAAQRGWFTPARASLWRLLEAMRARPAWQRAARYG
ncbi:glutathione S-transferase family protein [Dickeya fangzhongdai]|uniref:glutathione S-transferase family protein n=1 Tax=Dickeya fangzhongdai TaxID=1778540 RepID=UPI000EB19B6A|nr:glutathione S-transferase [Dickeya fangzhongdai]AYH47948.1 glutathione S-transferase [Dickeya fangzhongdai]MBO8134811.1 glutathione S-transferase [Dickeya fangzhongdai]ULR33026.1 glutathione S-transferase [Dickeya fangzhongdai]